MHYCKTAAANRRIAASWAEEQVIGFYSIVLHQLRVDAHYLALEQSFGNISLFICSSGLDVFQMPRLQQYLYVSGNQNVTVFMTSKRKTFGKPIIIISLLSMVVISFSECFGDMLGSAYRKHIVGNYYLVGVDSKDDILLCYETASGDCIGRVPPRVIEYGYSDSILVTKTKEYGKSFPSYYVIYLKKDSDYAHEEDFRIGPLAEKEFDNNWRNKFGIQMSKVK